MAMVIPLDLDAVPPERLERALESMKQVMAWATADPEAESLHRYEMSYYIDSDLYRNRPGFHPSHLFDWRKLEQRHHELSLRATQAREVLWTTIGQLWAWAKKKRQKEVWIHQPHSRSPEYMMVIHESSLRDGKATYSHKKMDELLDSVMGKPRKQALILRGDPALRFERLVQRDNAMSKRCGVVERAFVRAIEARVRSFADKELRLESEYHGCRHEEAYFHIVNDGRSYALRVDINGQIHWGGSRVYECR